MHPCRRTDGWFTREPSKMALMRSLITKELVLSQPKRSWDDYFDWVQTLDLPDDFLESRDQPIRAMAAP
jgi:hypothetical protein